MEERKIEIVEPKENAAQESFKCPNCQFAATCGDCYHNSGGWCRKHGGYVDPDKWACSDYA